MSDTPYGIGSRIWPGLAKVVEETGELNQVLAKLVATGGETDYYDGTDLREKLVEEIADVRAALALFTSLNVPEDDRARIDERAARKLEGFVRWHREHLT